MSPFLCKGITFAAFQAVGKVEESNERLITCVKAGSRLMAASLIICTSIMSRPVAFVGFKPCTTLTLFYAGGGGIYAPLPNIGNFLRTYLSEEAPSILKF